MRNEAISVVIPALNEADLLPRCLLALMPQAREHGAEVIVVDNGSTDETGAIARRFGATVVHEPRCGYVFALNRGVRASQHPIVAITDADTVVGTKWLASIVRTFRKSGVVASIGPVTFDGFPLFNLLRWVMIRQLWGANMAFRRSAYDMVGGFDERINLCVDIAFGRSLARHGEIAFTRGQAVRTSSRRFQRRPVQQSWHFLKNFLALTFLKRPVSWDFENIRDPEHSLHAKGRRRLARLVSAGCVLVCLYVLLWPQATLFGQIVVRPRVKAKLVALTFDDGPNGAATRRIVDILKAENVPATFFEVGRSVQSDPATAAYVAANGFPIGNHSWDHSYAIPFKRPSSIRNELDATSRAIEGATGTQPDLFRPPHGWRSPQLLMVTREEHMKVVNWSVDPLDYWTEDPRAIVRRVVRHIKPGSIVLLHDGVQDGPRARKLKDRLATIHALPEIIDELRAEGYQFVTVDQLLAERQSERSSAAMQW
jgi:peptidoglycan/xylan/chitin deacetylase (PgdA/CDA1 family)